MNCIEVRTQAELDAALAQPDSCPHLVGDGYFVVRGSATVRASGSATVEASDSATVRASGSATVEASDSATVRAWGSATVRASGSATVRAWGSATVRASGSATVEAWGAVMARLLGAAKCEAKSPHVVTTVHGKRAKAVGGHVIAIPGIKTAEDFCTWNGIEIEKISGRKVVQLFKAVDDEYLSGYGCSYKPGETPEAVDWTPTNACGGGLHFGATPVDARKYGRGDRFMRCPVYLSEVVPITDGDGSCDKVKAKRVISPGCVEVDVDGEALE